MTEIHCQFVNMRYVILFSILLATQIQVAWGQTKEVLDAYRLKYPKHHLVQLKDEMKIVVRMEKNVPVVEHQYSLEYLVLDNNGSLSLAEQRVGYSSFQQMGEIEAYTMVPTEKGSKKLPVKRIETRDAETSGSVFHDDNKEKVIFFPGLAPGALVHLSYSFIMTDNTFPFSYNFFASIPVESNKVTIEVDSSVHINHRLFHGDRLAIKYSENLVKNKRIYSWFSDKAMIIDNEDVAPEPRYYAPHLLAQIGYYTTKAGNVSLGQSIGDLHANYQQNVEQVENEIPDPELLRIADSIARPFSDEFDKVKAIYYWVQDHIKYIAIEAGMEGFVPRQPSAVLHKRYGDCKDMASLIYSMTKAIGIPTYLTWIGSRELPTRYTEFPSSFCDNHMIASYKKNGKIYFLDATDSFLSIEMPSSFIQGKEAFVHLGKDKFEIANVPVIPSGITQRIDSTWAKLDGKNMTGYIHSWHSGYYHSLITDVLRDMPKNELDKLSTSIYQRCNNSFLATNSTTKDVLEREKPAYMTCDWKASNYATTYNNEVYVNLLLDKNYIQYFDLKPDRVAPMEFPFAFDDQSVTIFEIPEGYEVKSVPKNVEFKTEFFEFSVTYKQEKTTVTSALHLKTNFILLDTANVQQWAKLLTLSKQAFSETLVLQKK